MKKTWYRQGTDLLKEIKDTIVSDDALAFWHLDHLALDTLTGIADVNPHTMFIVPGACVSMMTEAGISPQRITAANAHIPALGERFIYHR